jgi:hypothetical protein
VCRSSLRERSCLDEISQEQLLTKYLFQIQIIDTTNIAIQS